MYHIPLCIVKIILNVLEDTTDVSDEYFVYY